MEKLGISSLRHCKISKELKPPKSPVRGRAAARGVIPRAGTHGGVWPRGVCLPREVRFYGNIAVQVRKSAP